MSQISLETKIKLAPNKVISKAKQTFADEYGMEVTNEADCCIKL